MVQGTAGLPGGISAWLPTVCFIIIDSYLEARSQAKLSEEVAALRQKDLNSGGKGSRAGTAASSSGGERGGSGASGYGFEPNSDDEEAGHDATADDAADVDELFELIQPELRISLASAIVVILRGFDRFFPMP
eukprot:3330527-Pleurochrysis_carterae.AAC.1